MFCGPSNMGKTSVAASICSHIAKGESFCGLHVKEAAVFYIAAEDHEGVLERAHPFISGSSVEPHEFLVAKKPLDLTNDELIASFIAGIEDWKLTHGLAHSLIVIDTLALSIGNADENSARDMSQVLSSAQKIAKSTKAHVMVISHVALSEKGRPRGSTAIESTADSVLVLTKVDGATTNQVKISSTKQRSSTKLDRLTFEIRKEVVGYDNAHNKPISVPMAVPITGLAPNIDTLFSVAMSQSLSELRDSEIESCIQNICARKNTANRANIEKMAGSAFDGVRGNPDSLRKKVKESIGRLMTQGRIIEDINGGYLISISELRRHPVG